MTLKVEEIKKEESKYLNPSSNKFQFEQLKGFPEGVDPTKKEAYLSNEDFVKVFGMTIEKFYDQKKWKQTEKKKETGLF